MAASVGKPEPSMNFGSNTDKFKSGFGKDGSQIKKKEGNEYKAKDFVSSQRINTKDFDEAIAQKAEKLKLQEARLGRDRPAAEQNL